MSISWFFLIFSWILIGLWMAFGDRPGASVLLLMVQVISASVLFGLINQLLDRAKGGAR